MGSQPGSCVWAQAGDAALGQGWGRHSHPVSHRRERKGPPLLGGTPGMNTAAKEQTEPEELKGNEGGAGWGRAVRSGAPTPPGAQKLLFCLGLEARDGETHPIPPHRRTDSSDRAVFKSPLSLGGPGPCGKRRHGALVFLMGILRELRLPSDLRPRACRTPSPTTPGPEDLGQAESSGEAGEGQEQGRACGLRTHAHPHWPWLCILPRPGPRSLLGEVPVYVHVGLLDVADKGRR